MRAKPEILTNIRAQQQDFSENEANMVSILENEPENNRPGGENNIT